MNAEDRQAAFESIVARARHTMVEANTGDDDAPAKAPIDVLRENLFTISRLRTRPPQEWLVDKVVPRRGLGILWGESGSYKTFVALDLVCRIAVGLHAWQRRTARAKVLYICGEGEEGFLERLDAWLAAHPDVDPEALEQSLLVETVAPPLPEENQMWAHALATLAAETGADVVVIDTVARSFGAGSENDTRDMGLFVMACDRVRRAIDGCVLGVHHSGIERGRMRGNSSLYAACDFVLALQRPAPLQVTVTNAFEAKGKAKGAAEMTEPIAFVLEPFADSIVPMQVDELPASEPKPVDRGRRKPDVERLVELARGVRMLKGVIPSKRALADALETSPDTASKLIAVGLRTNRLTAVGAGWMPTDLLAWSDER